MADGIVYNHIPEIIAKLPQIRSQLVRAGAFNVQRYAQEGVAVDTGFAKNSIYTVTEDSSNNIHPSPTHQGAALFPDVANPPPGQALVVCGAFYGIFLEQGTIHMAARPFMLPAAEQARPEYQAAWQKLEGMLAI